MDKDRQMLLSAKHLSVPKPADCSPPVSRASSLSSVLTIELTEEPKGKLPQKDSGVCLCPDSESDLSQSSSSMTGELKPRKVEEAARMYSGRGRRHSAVATLSVIHDDEVAHHFKRSDSLGEIVMEANLANLATRRFSTHSTDSGNSMQSQLATIVDCEVLPSQPIIPACIVPARPCRRFSAVLYPAAAQQITLISPRNSDVYKSLPCRSHHKPLNLHSKALCKRQQESGLMCGQGDACMSPVVISPIMQLYMESNNPVLQDYVQKVLTLNSCGPDSCVCSTQASESSLPSWPACCQPAQPVHVTIDSASSTSSVSSSPEDDKKGRPLKPGVEQEVAAVRRHAVQDVIVSVLRNISCYMTLVGVVLLIAQRGFNEDMPLWRNITPLLLLAIGLLAIGLQVMHAHREIRRPASRTLIAEMLATQMCSHSDFMSMVKKRLSNAPYVAVEIKKRHRIPLKDSKTTDVEGGESSGQHWSRISKKISKMLAYDHWSDMSEDIEAQAWEQSRCHWIIVVKDYRAANRNTVRSINDDIAEFSRDSCFDETHPHGMRSKMILDVMEGEAHPDVQAYLVSPDHGTSRFYTFSIYKAMLCAGVDSLYSIVFHIATRYVGQYNIVKVIER